jgi:hypothetical protein
MDALTEKPIVPAINGGFWFVGSDGMNPEQIVKGAIVDSWVEGAPSRGTRTRLVLQVVPRGRPKDLLIVEAEPSLVPDSGWLEDLRENLCHGSPVSAVVRKTINGFFLASSLQLNR